MSILDSFPIIMFYINITHFLLHITIVLKSAKASLCPSAAISLVSFKLSRSLQIFFQINFSTTLSTYTNYTGILIGIIRCSHLGCLIDFNILGLPG